MCVGATLWRDQQLCLTGLQVGHTLYGERLASFQMVVKYALLADLII